MNNALTLFVDVAPTVQDLGSLSLTRLRAIRAAAMRVERAAWAEEGRRVALGREREIRFTRDREMLPNRLRARVLSGELSFKRVNPRALMQCRDWALQICEACDAALHGKGEKSPHTTKKAPR